MLIEWCFSLPVCTTFMDKLSQKNAHHWEPWQIHPLKLIEDNHLKLVVNMKTAQIGIKLFFNALSKFLLLQLVLSIVSRTLNRLNVMFIFTVSSNVLDWMSCLAPKHCPLLAFTYLKFPVPPDKTLSVKKNASNYCFRLVVKGSNVLSPQASKFCLACKFSICLHCLFCLK